ncbi:MAG TPA: hypothetical protein VJL28_07510 [Gemmatimonadaceae bacterium]|nr:hypothetical protein [Gemmatimonadaceae bacterium]
MKNHPVLLLAGAVAASAAFAQAPTVRDSAGVRIVENTSRATAPVLFTLGTTARFDIGGLEQNPDDEFNSRQRNLRGAWLSNGGVAVIDGVRIHYFDKTGKRLRIVGRQGKGPEEFSDISTICRTRGDTIIVTDGNPGRMAVVSGSGAAVRTFLQDSLGSPPFDGCLDDGTVLFRPYSWRTPRSPSTARLTRRRLDGTIVNLIGDFDPGVLDYATGVVPTVAARGQRVYWGDPRTSEVRIFSVTGKLLSIIRSADVGGVLSSEDAERLFRSTFAPNTPPAIAQMRVDRMRSFLHASTWPTYREFHVDPNGRIWIEDYARTHPSADGWTLFDAQGRLVGRLVLPAPKQGERPLLVIGFGVDEMFVRRADENGAAHLTVYPIVRAAP